MGSEPITDHHKAKRASPAWVVETVRRVQRGEAVEVCFELLFREYEPAVRRRLRARGWRGADLDDLVQDVMLRVYRGIGGFRLASSFETWVLQIMSNAAKNAVRDRHTAKARLTGLSLDSLLDGDGASMPEPEAAAPGPLDETLAAERKERLAAALDQLPRRVRECLLFRYHGFKLREIAGLQGVSLATVKKQVYEGHRRLRPLLGPAAELFVALLVAVRQLLAGG